MKSTKYLLVLLSLLLFSCNIHDYNSGSTLKSGVVITFDDNFVNEWYDVNNVLEVYDWKATFFVTKFDKLSIDEIRKLKSLKNQGHEIGGHGLNHINAASFIAQYGTDEYLNKEIFPMLNVMNNNSFIIDSFSYPYGARDITSDAVLLKEFKVVRATTYNKSSPATQDCYYSNNRIIYGLGIDKNYPHYSIPYFLSLLEYAKANNKIVVFYAHKPVVTSEANYETEYETLKTICKYVKDNKMKFYKVSDLYNLSI